MLQTLLGRGKHEEAMSDEHPPCHNMACDLESHTIAINHYFGVRQPHAWCFFNDRPGLVGHIDPPRINCFQKFF